MKGIIALSFGLGSQEPSPCNRRIAREVGKIFLKEEKPILLACQWEIARALPSDVPIAVVIGNHRGTYLDSQEVISRATDLFKEVGVDEVIMVAQPWLHLQKCRRLVRQAGFKVIRRRIGWIGFYKDSLQWWTRGPLQLLAYAVLQRFTGRRGY